LEKEVKINIINKIIKIKHRGIILRSIKKLIYLFDIDQKIVLVFRFYLKVMDKISL